MHMYIQYNKCIHIYNTINPHIHTYNTINAYTHTVHMYVQYINYTCVQYINYKCNIITNTNSCTNYSYYNTNSIRFEILHGF